MPAKGIRKEPRSLIFDVLKHPIRREMLRMLSRGPMTYTEILDAVCFSTGRLNYHLEKLGKLLSKNDARKYQLSTLGVTALNLLDYTEKPISRKLKDKVHLFRRTDLLFFCLLLMSGIGFCNIEVVHSHQFPPSPGVGIPGCENAHFVVEANQISSSYGFDAHIVPPSVGFHWKVSLHYEIGSNKTVWMSIVHEEANETVWMKALHMASEEQSDWEALPSISDDIELNRSGWYRIGILNEDSKYDEHGESPVPTDQAALIRMSWTVNYMLVTYPYLPFGLLLLIASASLIAFKVYKTSIDRQNVPLQPSGFGAGEGI